jgi:hypothetical protein
MLTLRLRLLWEDVVLSDGIGRGCSGIVSSLPGLVSIFLQATPGLKSWAKLFRRSAAGLVAAPRDQSKFKSRGRGRPRHMEPRS